MYFLAVATDDDGTIAHHGSVKAEIVAAHGRVARKIQRALQRQGILFLGSTGMKLS
jgi:hypothetical protein